MERRKSRWIRCVSFNRMRGQRKGGKEDWEEQKRRWGGGEGGRDRLGRRGGRGGRREGEPKNRRVGLEEKNRT